MNHKVLLADDSLTIQKVIKITLANQPYDIVDASTEDELFQKLSQNPKLVFLDFNLSEKYSGYELCTKIKAINPSTQVLLLLGTFDTVDDAALEKCGASDKIVKPFDSNKFIFICKKLIESFEENGAANKAAPAATITAKPNLPKENAEDQWKMNHSTEHKLESKLPQAPMAQAKSNPLHSEISDWGMSVPGVIDNPHADDDHLQMPPVIGETPSGPKMPASSDLDYPTVEEITKTSPPRKSNLISIDSFRTEEPTAEFEIQGSYIPDDTNIRSLEEQIADEVSEDLWKADEFENLKNEISSKVEQMSSGFQSTTTEFDDNLFRPIDDSESISWTDIETKAEPQSQGFNPHSYGADNFQSGNIEELVKKHVKEYMDEMFKNKVEKIAWEIIPDLAENLIRQELSKIAEKILKDSK